MPIVYLNGEYVDLSAAKVSVEDRGFLFADGVYEVVRYYSGHAFCLKEHLSRLAYSAAGAYLSLPDAVRDLPHIMERVLSDSSPSENGEVYIQCTRGVAHPRGHPFPRKTEPTLLVMPIPLHAPPEKALSEGLSVITTPDLRWGRCDIKSTMLLPNVTAKQHAREQGAFEAIFVRDGIITEGASTNVFAVIDGCLTTHPADRAVLGGISRRVVLELARGLGLETCEAHFTVEQLRSSQEVLLSSTTIEVLPVTHTDGQPIGDGRPGAIAMRLYEAFQKLTASLRESEDS
jgi:D-alanine transaminase